MIQVLRVTGLYRLCDHLVNRYMRRVVNHIIINNPHENLCNSLIYTLVLDNNFSVLCIKMYYCNHTFQAIQETLDSIGQFSISQSNLWEYYVSVVQLISIS